PTFRSARAGVLLPSGTTWGAPTFLPETRGGAGMSRTAIKRSVAVEPMTLQFTDDGLVPNNPRLPLLLYRGAMATEGEQDKAAAFESAFAANGWGDCWRNGIYEFLHFHSMIHEVLGIAAGEARV